ncbi:MAG: hypothetical protein ACOCRK_07275 [bacterium]
MYKLGEVPGTSSGLPGHGWRPGYVGIYVGEKIDNFGESKKEGTAYDKGDTIVAVLGIGHNLLSGDRVKTGQINCVGLAEVAY